MSKIKKLNQNGEDILPVTHEEAVFDSNGVSIGTKINNLEDDMINLVDIGEIEDIDNGIIGRIVDIENKLDIFQNFSNSINLLNFEKNIGGIE